MMGCHFQDRPCHASLCLRELCQGGNGRPRFQLCDEMAARSCPHRAWDHATHLEVCGRRTEVTSVCSSCGGRHRFMSEVLRCEITHSIERAFQEGSPKRTGPAPCLFGEHVPSYMTSSAWRTIRDRVLERDGRRCRECGKNLAEAPSWFTEVHHLVPRSEGGSDHPSNLVTLCVMCHKRITAETLFARTLVSYFSDEEFLPRDCLEAFK